MLNTLFKIYSHWQINFFVTKIIDDFKRDLPSDERFYDRLRYPLHDYDKTISQYKCQIRVLGLWPVLLLNFFSFLAFPILLIFFLLRKRAARLQKGSILCFNCDNAPSIYPDEISQNGYVEAVWGEENRPNIEIADLKLLFGFIKRNPLHYWLTIRVLYKFALYRALIQRYQPNAIVVTAENTATSSALTFFCNKNNVLHYNIMQGEMFATVNIAFFHFDICYVWDEHYIKAFVKYGAPIEQFRIHNPASLNIDIIRNRVVGNSVDYTYYLGDVTEKEIKIIASCFEQLEHKGYTCRVRPHFRWTNMVLVEKFFDKSKIENFVLFSIEQSISSTSNCVSIYSTVLYQAYCSGRNVVIDDLSSVEKFDRLNELDYIMLKKQHSLLSNILK